MVIILDVETLDMRYNFVYDIAWATIERNKIKTTKNFIVQEFLTAMQVGSFSAEKAITTLQEVENGNAQILPYAEIMQILEKDMSAANYVYAYNASFDRGKIIATASELGLPDIAETFKGFNEKWRCLWAWATNTVLYKQSFIKFCEDNGYMTEKGNCKTSAEIALKFITADTDYTEQHTALADIMDEYLIYLEIKKAVKAESKQPVLNEDDFRGSWHNIAKLKRAIET